MFDRQLRMFGSAGQQVLGTSKIAVIGLGGIGSLIAEFLARIGVGHLILVDPDAVEESNLSRVVGATCEDAAAASKKTDVAVRHIKEAARHIEVTNITDDVAKCSVVRQLRTCDFVFLAADSMRARLVINALTHQYFVPCTQVGSKIRSTDSDALDDAFSVVRSMRPGEGCLWCNQLVDPTQLAIEAKSDAERKAQAYGTNEPNPSVLTLNAVAAAEAVNDFLFDYLGLRESKPVSYRHIHFLQRRAMDVQPRKDESCRECGVEVGRFGKGDGAQLPCVNG